LEWGTGKSISYYPTLAKQAYIIDNYSPWCEKVAENPVASCMKRAKRLQFSCHTPTNEKGEQLAQVVYGRMPEGTSIDIIRYACLQHLKTIENFSPPLEKGTLDSALVDGRWRPSVAMYLMQYLHDDSVVLWHDFTMRVRPSVILKYFDVIGRSRSTVALRKKPANQLPPWEEIKKEYTEYCGYE